MLHTRAPASAVLLAALLAAGGALAESDHVHLEHRSVQIATSGLLPATLRLGPEETVAWSNYSEHVALVVFDADVASHLLCEEPSNFQMREGRLVSSPLSRHEFAAVCRFEPGEYDYRVELLEEGDPSAEPARRFEGRLVVEEPDAG